MLRLLFAAALAFTFTYLHAESAKSIAIADKVANGKIISMDGKELTKEERDSMQNLIATFYYSQFRHFDDPDAPYFMFMSRDAQLSMGIGGKIKTVGWYEWHGAVPDKGLVPFLIPIPEDPAATRHLGVDVGGTALFFRVIGRHRLLGLYQLYIEAGFSGYKNRDFKLKKAYANIRDFTVGYAESTFSDPSTLAPDIDAQGSTSQFDLTRVLVRYMPSFCGGKYTVAVSAEYPEDIAIQDDPSIKATDIWLPDFAAFLQYAWNKDSHVRASGILRTMGYRDLVVGKNHNVVGWGAQLSATSTVGDHLVLYGQVNIGRGMAGMTQDLASGNYDLISDPDKAPGNAYAPKSWGWSAGVEYDFNSRWLVSAQAAQTRFLPSSQIDPEEYKYGLYAAVNSFYSITPRVKVGGQFTWGQRHNFNHAHKAARRIEALAQFSF